jgi:hypothetical protein
MVKHTNKSSAVICGPRTKELIAMGLAALAAVAPASAGNRRPADLNTDGVVNAIDLVILLDDWSQDIDATGCKGRACKSDLSGDGIVNGTDLGILLADWG